MSKPVDSTTDEVAEKTYTTDELAEIFFTSPWVIRKWLNQGIIRGTKTGHNWSVTQTDLQAYLKEKHG